MADQGIGEPLRGQLPLGDTFVLVGCPDWCSWTVTEPEHWHESADGAEVAVRAVYSVSEDRVKVEVLEVRHCAAPERPRG